MTNSIQNLLSYCSDIEFGPVDISAAECDFYQNFNDEIISLCRSLPESIQIEAINFCMKYSGIAFGKELNFFKHFYTPTWSILYWLNESSRQFRNLTRSDIEHAITIHALAMFLHSLDDHLNDGEIPATHLILLIRSQAWMTMNHAIEYFCSQLTDGAKRAQKFLDAYYGAISKSYETGVLDTYCDLFKKQMSIGLIAPVLLMSRMAASQNFTDDMITAYCAFGIAWRLLDDIKDIKIDMAKSIHSAVYVCLPRKMQHSWNQLKLTDLNQAEEKTTTVLNCIKNKNIIGCLKERICHELEIAASIADRHDMPNFAGEFRSLLKPLLSDE